MKAFQRRFFKDILCQPDRQYNVPVYQREYSWENKNCEKLFNDILDSSKHDKKHYLGSIVYVSTESKDVDECLVIDGQQRITTMVLLLKAMLDSIDINNEEEVKIKNKILGALYNSDCDEKYKLKLKPIDSDNIQLEYVLMDGFDNVDATSNISKNYENFKRLISELKTKKKDLEYIYNGILNLEIVEIILDENDNAQLIFESINSTGLKLSKSDLIRNYLLMDITKRADQEEYYKKYWLPLEKRLKNKDNLEKFFYDFLIMKNTKYIVEENIYENFKDYVFVSQYETKKEIFVELTKFSKYYQLLVCNDNKEYLSKTNKICANFNVLKHNTIYPFLLKVCDDQNNLDSFKEIELQNILELFFNYALRRLIIGIPSSSLRRFYATLYSNIFKKKENKNHYYKSIESFICQLLTNDKMPSNTEFENSLKEINIYKKGSVLKFLFNIIENAHSKEKVDFSNLTIEHIMPQTLNKDWEKMLGENYKLIYEKYINTLGNLSITGYNSEYSNESFSIKKKLLNEVETKILTLNKEMFNSDVWNEDIITIRANRLAGIIKCEYPYPTNVDYSLEFDIFTEIGIDEDMSEYQGLKPYGYSLNSKKYKAGYYKDIYISLLNNLYDLNPKILIQLAKDKFKFTSGTRINLSEDKNDIPHPSEIASGKIYAETNFNKDMLIYLMKYMLDEYDIDHSNLCLVFMNELTDEE